MGFILFAVALFSMTAYAGMDQSAKNFCAPGNQAVFQNLFFQLISRRYEKGSMSLTSNHAYANWGDVFGDPVIASAILDRLLHHATTVNIKGESYRLKEKRKAGLLSRLMYETKTESL